MAIDIFTQLHFDPLIREWFNRQYEEPSPPQLQGWPAIAAGQHTLILAPTGSGKTLAAFLWAINQQLELAGKRDPKIFADNPDGVHTLYISPLKALNNDIQRNLRHPLHGLQQLARQKGRPLPEIRTAVRSGDTPAHLRQSMLKHPPHILITTPESLYLLLTSERGRQLFRNLRYVIVDEIHALSTNKRGVHLSLSLERLMPLCKNGPVRIGLSATQRPLERVAAFLGGQVFEASTQRPRPRPVTIIDCGQRRDMDVRVVCPVDKFTDLPDDSVWEPLYDYLYDLITQHKTTLIFANMRAQTERIARHLNDRHRNKCGDEQARIALAHHSSISREARYEIEERLKQGKIAAVVATASLELGIDIGSIDLVIHLESPKSVAIALQRIGRSGHLLSATSKGRIIPLYPADLDDAVALTRALYHSDIEEITIPENALDVLAQQIVAEVSMRACAYDELYRLIRQSYCYRHLSPLLFDNVLDMLCGKFSDERIRFLSPRLSWDKVNNQLTVRKGSRLLATLNGGTIPDRGYYGVYLKDSTIRLGEVEEEFVNETRVGEAFFLGNSEWRLDSITNDRITVTPVAAIQPKAPFWKGDVLYRDVETSRKIGQFREELLKKIDHGEALPWLMKEGYADRPTAANLIDFITRQRDQGGEVAGSHRFVGEWTAGSAGEPLFIMHSPLGARLTGLWAIALAAALEKEYRTQVQYTFDDDGFLLRFLETTQEPPIESIIKTRITDFEALLTAVLPDSPVFLVQFRYNVTRALLLPRSQTHKRIPLWLQRLRASDLMQVVKDYPDFPILHETYRTVLQDVFDWNGLKKVLQEISADQITVKIVHTPHPSPMASPLVFKLVARTIYEYDLPRRTGQPFTASQTYLQQILDLEHIPAIISADLVKEVESHWQFLHPHKQAQSVEDLFLIIEELGPLQEEELQQRSARDIKSWLEELALQNRIVQIRQPIKGWLAAAQETIFRTNNYAAQKTMIMDFLMMRGPLEIEAIGKRFPFIPREALRHILETLKAERRVISGRLIHEFPSEFWCELNNFYELYRLAIGRRRLSQKPADRPTFFTFQLHWHGILGRKFTLSEIMDRYTVCRFPLFFFEREILSNRLNTSEPLLNFGFEELKQAISRGEINVRCERLSSEGRFYLRFLKYGQGHHFVLDNPLANDLSPSGQLVMTFLRENGASRLQDLEWGLSLPSAELSDVLAELCTQGLVSSDHYGGLLALLKRAPRKKDISSDRLNPIQEPPQWLIGRRGNRPSRSQVAKKVQQEWQVKEGRWFLTDSFSFSGKPVSDEDKAEFQVRLLLNRYGIVVKDWFRNESALLPWYPLFQILKRLEWQGEIRRGYFIHGLSGLQFALHGAVELLDNIQEKGLGMSDSIAMLSTLDAAMPLGRSVPWNLTRADGQPLSIVRQASNHLLIVNGQPCFYSENYARRLWILKQVEEETIHKMTHLFKNWLKMPADFRSIKQIVIETIDGLPAVRSNHAKNFCFNGFEENGEKLILWPSMV
jgi:ATP-dependent helicase Lhr and Lhr-like helicase